jgi:hypothetical protein
VSFEVFSAAIVTAVILATTPSDHAYTDVSRKPAASTFSEESLKVDATDSSETPVNLYQSKRHHMPVRLCGGGATTSRITLRENKDRILNVS